jgi:hypothetical protein
VSAPAAAARCRPGWLRPAPTTRAAPSSLAFCAARKPDIPVTPRTRTVPRRPASAWRAFSGSQDAIPGLTPAATASGGAPGGSGNLIAPGEAMRSAKVPYGGSPDEVNTSSPPAVRATALSPGISGKAAPRL